METFYLLLILVYIGIIGFIITRKFDIFMDENKKQQSYVPENRKEEIRQNNTGELKMDEHILVCLSPAP